MPSAVSMPGQHTRSTRLSRLAAIQESRVYPAWRQSRNPGFIPLGGDPGIHFIPLGGDPGIHFIPLGGDPGTQVLSRLAAIQEPRFYPAWR